MRPRKAAKTGGEDTQDRKAANTREEETQDRDMGNAVETTAEFDKQFGDIIFDPTRDIDFDLRGLSLQGIMNGYNRQQWK